MSIHRATPMRGANDVYFSFLCMSFSSWRTVHTSKLPRRDEDFSFIIVHFVFVNVCTSPALLLHTQHDIRSYWAMIRIRIIYNKRIVSVVFSCCTAFLQSPSNDGSQRLFNRRYLPSTELAVRQSRTLLILENAAPSFSFHSSSTYYHYKLTSITHAKQFIYFDCPP